MRQEMPKLFATLLVIVSLSLAAHALADTAESHYANGVELLKKKQLDQAIPEFTRALEINSRFAEAYALRGIVYGAKGQFNKAIVDSTMALEINPRLAPAYQTRAIGYFAKRRFNQAWDDVHQAQSLGFKVDPKFLEKLRRGSGRQN